MLVPRVDLGEEGDISEDGKGAVVDANGESKAPLVDEEGYLSARDGSDSDGSVEYPDEVTEIVKGIIKQSHLHMWPNGKRAELAKVQEVDWQRECFLVEARLTDKSKEVDALKERSDALAKEVADLKKDLKESEVKAHLQV